MFHLGCYLSYSSLDFRYVSEILGRLKFSWGPQRGVTLAPRIDVYTQIACDELHALTQTHPFDTLSSRTPSALLTTPTAAHPRVESTKFSFVTSQEIRDSQAASSSSDAAAVPKECSDDPVVHSRAAQIQASMASLATPYT